MVWLEKGKISGAAIILPKSLPLPEGTEVTVRIETAATAASESGPSAADFSSLGFFGMWANRPDMADSAEWVRRQREQWQ